MINKTTIALLTIGILLSTMLAAGCTHTEPTYTNITVTKIHYLGGVLQSACIIMDSEGETHGVYYISDCLKLENSTAMAHFTPSGQIDDVRVI